METDERSWLSTKYRLEWISDCEYKLTQLYANKKAARKRNQTWLIYKIVSTTENSYTCHCSCSDKRDVQGTVVKME